MFSRVMNRASLSGNAIDESSLMVAGRTVLYLPHLPSVKFGGEGLWCGVVFQGLLLAP